jgi:hypothetical protein
VLISTTADLQDDGQASEALRAAQAGDREAVARLLALVYAELRRLARARVARLARRVRKTCEWGGRNPSGLSAE